MEERRQFVRVRYSNIILLYNSKVEIVAEVEDFSLSGAFVRLRHGGKLNVGDKLSYAIVLSNKENIVIKGDATVVRCDGNDGYGIACKTVNMDYFVHLKRLIELNYLKEISSDEPS